MKHKRQMKILEIIRNHNIETQDELLEMLADYGFVATQATISRDIRELKLRKEVYKGTRQRYTEGDVIASGTTDSYRKVLSAGIISIESSENLIVIKTVSGVAMAVGAALDNMEIRGLMGCIAGDDTIFLAVQSKKLVENVVAEIKKVAYPKK